MKKAVLASVMAATLATPALADQAQSSNQNYGDPTNAYTGLSVGQSFNGDRDVMAQAGFKALGGNNILLAELGSISERNISGSKPLSIRARYFYIHQTGLGFNLDYKSAGNDNDYDWKTSTLVAGVNYKFDVTDQFLVMPMLNFGRADVAINGLVSEKSDVTQAGAYFMYGFQAGHWVYANPTYTYLSEPRDYMTALEVGAGIMLTSNTSMGLKNETQFSGGMNDKTENRTTIQASIYF